MSSTTVTPFLSPAPQLQSQSMPQRNIKDVMQQAPEFKECVECRSSDCEWISLSHWVVLCRFCSGAHRNLPGTRVKSLREERCTDEELQELLRNIPESTRKNRELEKYLPVHYQRPTPRCSLILRSEFVKAKYLDRQFEQPNTIHYLTEASVMMPRVFAESRGILVDCEIAIVDRGHALRISDRGSGGEKLNELCRMDKIQLCFLSSSMGNSASGGKDYLMICFDHKTSFRFVYFHGRFDLQYRLLQTIRKWQFHLIKLNQSGMASPLSEAEMANQLSPSDIHVGWLCKTGPRLKEQWRRRWCILFHRRLYYFHNAFDFKLRGFVEFCGDTFAEAQLNPHLVTQVDVEMPNQCRHSEGFPLVLKSVKREFVFAAEDQQQQLVWKEAFCRLIPTALLPPK